MGDTRFGPDGYQYGLRFKDGSVSSHYNGRTQRTLVEQVAAKWREMYRDEFIVPVRHRHGEPWQSYGEDQ